MVVYSLNLLKETSIPFLITIEIKWDFEYQIVKIRRPNKNIKQTI